jgi:hypothetical protein
MESLVQFLPLLFIIGVLYVLVRYTPRRRPLPRVGTQSAFSPRVIRFRNSANGYEEAVGTPWIWCLLFGCVYFAAKGIWTHAVAALLLALLTAGLSWLVYPFFARQIVETHYLRRGWIPT